MQFLDFDDALDRRRIDCCRTGTKAPQEVRLATFCQSPFEIAFGPETYPDLAFEIQRDLMGVVYIVSGMRPVKPRSGQGRSPPI